MTLLIIGFILAVIGLSLIRWRREIAHFQYKASRMLLVQKKLPWLAKQYESMYGNKDNWRKSPVVILTIWVNAIGGVILLGMALATVLWVY